MKRYVADAARQIYGQNEGGQINTLEPRLKFQFSVNLFFRTNPNTIDGGVTALDMSRIASVTMPGITFKTETLNQYNLKRTIQTGVDYSEVTIEAYDTRDGNIESFLKLYSNYYYHNVMKNVGEPLTVYNQSVAGFGNSEEFIGGSQAGYKLPVNKYCITNLFITRKHPNDTNVIELINPMITRIEHDTLDYSDSQPVRYRITFAYESYRISTSDK